MLWFGVCGGDGERDCEGVYADDDECDAVGEGELLWQAWERDSDCCEFSCAGGVSCGEFEVEEVFVSCACA